MFKYTLLCFGNSPPRYLSEFLFGGRVAGRGIYYLFVILYFCSRYGRVHCWASYLLSFGNLPGESVGELSNIFSNSRGEFGIGRVAEAQYCILGCGEIAAWRARGASARVSVNFRKFSPWIRAPAARARGFDSLPSLSDVATVIHSFQGNLLLILLLYLGK